MLDGLLGRGFLSKCKSLIKPTKTRLDVIRKRAEAKQRFLKEDLAKLLANGLDINAYGRTEEFIGGLRLLSCYDFIEHFCDHILKNLSTMQKQRECPEECREAVSSLMFAAARFSDLPELRELRDAFKERYGNSVEHSVNQVFVERLASRPPTFEKRLQLLRDIALEFSIKWDSRGFEQRMANPSAFVQDQNKKYGPPHVTNNGNTDLESDKQDVITKERGAIINGQTIRNIKDDGLLRKEEEDKYIFRKHEKTRNGNKPLRITGEKGEKNDISSGRQELDTQKHKSLHWKEDIVPTVSSGSSSRGKSSVDGYRMQNIGVNTIPNEGRQYSLFREKLEVSESCAAYPSSSDAKSDLSVGRQNIAKSTRKLQDEEADRLKSYYNSPRPPPYVKLKDNVIPPPYVKPKGNNHEVHTGSKHTNFDGDCSSMDRSLSNKANAILNLHRNPKEQDHSHQGEGFGSTRVNGHSHKKDPSYPPHRNPKDQDHSHQEEGFGPTGVNGHGHEKDPYENDIPLPRPRSHRKKHTKTSSDHHDENTEDGGTVKRSSSSRRKDHSRKGLQILFDDEHHKKDEEERMMDKLLLHYSKKSSTCDVGKLRRKTPSHASNQMDTGASEFPHGRRDGPDVNPEMVPHPVRSVSLPPEQSGPSEATKVYARANSFQADNQAPHVHPKLPDYDDLAARFAALRGR